MTEPNPGPANRPFLATERTGTTASGHAEEAAARAVSTTAPSPGKGKRFARFGLFVFALLKGTVIALVSFMILWGILVGDGDEGSLISAGSVLACFASMFLGGMVSGHSLEPAFANRRWGFLWLAAGSPALPVWTITVVEIIAGVDTPPAALGLISIACVGAFAGSGVGAHCRSWATTHRGIFWTAIGRAMATGISGVGLILGASFVLVVVPALVVAHFLDILGIGGIQVLMTILVIASGGVALFLGGLVSGHMMFPVLPRDPSRFVFVALANPAIVLLCIYGILLLSNTTLPGGWWRYLFVASVIMPALGSYSGYWAGCRERMRRERRAANKRRKNPAGGDG